MTQIPKIIHQLWIGDKPAPTRMMDTWRDMNPEFEYIRWSEAEFKKREMKFICKKRIQEMDEINGKADIQRWEILYKYGGVFIDADSYCVSPIDDQLMKTKAFAGWEHEQLRPGLVATGTMGFPPNHALVSAAINWIMANCVDPKKIKAAAWQSVGPGLLTRMLNTKIYKDVHIFPSYYFLPIHCTGHVYNKHGQVYAYQEWGSTKKSYETMNQVELPVQFTEPQEKVSILVSSYNTKAKYIKECLDSIKNQVGRFTMEIVWINDGSDTLNTRLLQKLLEKFDMETRYTTVIYKENKENKGIGYSLHRGINLCTNELIIKMDSDDIMMEDRILKQLTVMINNPQLMICGSQITSFDDVGKERVGSNHPSLTWEEYKAKPNHWFVNHPTVCYRKQAVIDAGNYNPKLSRMSEDFELELRMLKKYKLIYNLPESLLKYRLHPGQVTHNGGEEGRSYWMEKRMEIINGLVEEELEDEESVIELVDEELKEN
jgi:mannosyltransferase OCH1-like enzyme